MRVAFVAQPLDGVVPPRQNSLGLIVYNTVLAMADDAKAVIYASGAGDDSEHGPMAVDVRFVRSRFDSAVASLVRDHPRWAKRSGLDALADANLGYVRGVANELRSAPYDVVHVMNYWAMCRRLRRASGRARIVLEMQSEWLSQMERSKVSRQLAAVDCVVAVSDHIGNLFRAAYPGFGGVVATVYNGVDVEAFRPGPIQPAGRREAGGPRLLFVGRVSPEKGIHTLVEAFHLVVKRFPGATLDLVGPRADLPERFLVGLSSDPLVRNLRRFYAPDGVPNYQRAIDELIRDLGVGASVRFSGGLPHRDLIARYRSADIVVNPSLSESFGISMVEGMACGVPVVGAAVGGMRETIVDGATGRLVPPEDSDALAGAIMDIWENPNLARQMSEAGRERAVAVFSWRARASRILAAYRSVGVR